MFFIIIVLFLILSFFSKPNESFQNLDSTTLSSLINQKINNSNFNFISSEHLYNLFQFIYLNYDNYESALILFNNRNLFNRFFILEKQELFDSLDNLNNILSDKDYNYKIVSKNSSNLDLWNILLTNSELTIKDHLNNIIMNTNEFSNPIDRRRYVMTNNELLLFFKGIIDEIGPIDFNS
jgi:hypothetical protein